MLITSHFHDFYDSATAYGIDKTVVYKRETSVIEKLKFNREFRPPYVEVFRHVRRGPEWYNYTVSKYLIGFCGKIHPVIRVQKDVFNGSRVEDVFFYEAPETVEYLKKEKIGLGKQERRYFSWFRDFGIKDEKNIERFFDLSHWKALEDQFRERNVPIFVYGEGFPLDKTQSQYHRAVLQLNPCLKNHHFAKVKDPVTAFQDIHQFISGYLGVPSNPMIEVSDEIKAASRGHDGEFSFKKPPGGGRWR